MAPSHDPHDRTPGISVVMPAYNAAHYMPVVLDPLLKMRAAGEIDEILVVDDQSTDDTADAARALGATVIVNTDRGGPGAARNLAARHAVGDILWFVDSDVIAHPGGAAKIRAAFAEPDVVAVFGSYDDAPAGQDWMSRYKNLVHRYYHQRARREASTFWAGCGAVSKAALLDIDGFDVVTFTRPSIEDIDLGYRLRAAGGRILLLPDLLGKHLKIWTVGNVLRTDIFMRALPWSRLLISREGLTDDLNVSSGERLRAAVAWMFVLALLSLPLWPAWWPLAALCGAAVLALNMPLLRFMARHGGAGFTAFAFLWHQVYYLYSSAIFAYCMAEAAVSRNGERRVGT